MRVHVNSFIHSFTARVFTRVGGGVVGVIRRLRGNPRSTSRLFSGSRIIHAQAPRDATRRWKREDISMTMFILRSTD